MNVKSSLCICLMLSILFVSFGFSAAEDLKTIQLPEPRIEGGRPLMEVLKDRESAREFSTEKLPMQELSNLLWAAFGVNRSDIGKRTAPSAKNKQEIDIFVATADGLYLYEPKEHALRVVLAEDIRAATGLQPFVKDAPVNLVFVADFAKMVGYTEAQKEFYSAANTGYISQNVYLYCASEGLATVARGLVDRPALAKKMGLRPDQRVILAQTVGYPKK